MPGTIFDLVSQNMNDSSDEILKHRKGEAQGSRIVDLSPSGRYLEALPREYKVPGQGTQMMVDPKLLNSIASSPPPAPPPAPDVVTSDQNLKTDIKDATKAVDQFLSPLGTHQYQYKNPDKDGIGTFYSPMAQELEAAGPVGKSLVVNTKEGKKVDYQRGFGMALSALASHNMDIKELQKTTEYLKKAIQSRKK